MAVVEKATSNADYIDSILADVLEKAESRNICCVKLEEFGQNVGPKTHDEYKQTTSKTVPTFLLNTLSEDLCHRKRRYKYNSNDSLNSLAECYELPRIHSSCRHSLVETETSDEEIIIYEKYPMLKTKLFTQTACQTSKLHLKRLTSSSKGYLNQEQLALAPCELTKQTLFIEAVSYPTPSILSRAPLLDRFCYMLTDFATALYCSVAIMCCCTPNLFVQTD